MVKGQVHVFTRKRTAIAFRDKAVNRGFNVSRITNINEKAGGRVYKYRLVISKKPRPRKAKR